MTDPCITCPLSKCDMYHPKCLYKPGKFKRARRARAQFLAMNEAKKAIASMGFKKYDKRRKPNTPQRELWRLYKTK